MTLLMPWCRSLGAWEQLGRTSSKLFMPRAARARSSRLRKLSRRSPLVERSRLAASSCFEAPAARMPPSWKRGALRAKLRSFLHRARGHRSTTTISPPGASTTKRTPGSHARSVQPALEVEGALSRRGRSASQSRRRKPKRPARLFIGEEVTFELPSGRRTRSDLVVVTEEGLKVRESKEGPSARMTTPQRQMQEAARRGQKVIPRGENAREAGLPPGEKLRVGEFEEDRY